MINRSLLINTKDVKGDAIGYFATLLNIKNYFSFEEESYETVDQSFHDRREDWFEYGKLLGDFNYALDIGMYVDYDTFICLMKDVSLNGFKIAIPDELQISPFVYDLLDNGKFLKVLIYEEEKKDSEDIETELVYDNDLKSNVLFEQFNINNSKFWNKVIILFLYWASEKNILNNTLQVFIEKLKKEFDLLTENNLILVCDNTCFEKLLSEYFNKSSVEFVKFYIYYSKKFFFDIIKSSNEKNIFNSYLMDLNERDIQGIDYVKLWIDYKERDTFSISKNKFYELLNIFDKRYQEYCGLYEATLPKEYPKES